MEGQGLPLAPTSLLNKAKIEAFQLQLWNVVDGATLGDRFYTPPVLREFFPVWQFATSTVQCWALNCKNCSSLSAPEVYKNQFAKPDSRCFSLAVPLSVVCVCVSSARPPHVMDNPLSKHLRWLKCQKRPARYLACCSIPASRQFFFICAGIVCHSWKQSTDYS